MDINCWWICRLFGVKESLVVLRISSVVADMPLVY